MITQASALWTTWVNSERLRPAHYDKDIADALRRALSSAPGMSLGDAMDAARWEPRDLLRFLVPYLSSFTGMLRDLLSLYARIQAHQADKRNLRISYSFDPAHPVDDDLAAFAERTTQYQTALAMIDRFVFPIDVAFDPPLRLPSHDRLRAEGARLLGLDPAGDHRNLPTALPAFSATGDAARDELLLRHRRIIEETLEIARRHEGDIAELDEAHRSIPSAISDQWLTLQLGINSHLADPNASPLRAPSASAAFAAWLEKFWHASRVPVQVAVDAITDVLSLPDWGMRHELYSAWITTQIDTALGVGRLEFEVNDGVLEFPFKDTLLASFDTADGATELWCELRTSISAPLPGGHTQGVQPDYRFVRAGASVAAVEVKQYARAAAKKHALVMIDYLMALPTSEVLLVGHGPLGPSIPKKIPAALRPRATIHPHVRPEQTAAQTTFRARIAALFPPPSPPLRLFPPGSELTLTLTWNEDVKDLDLHALTASDETFYENPSTTHADLCEDAYDGGPERMRVRTFDQDARIEVHLFSTDAPSVWDASPRIHVGIGSETVCMIVPSAHADPSAARIWQVATVSDVAITLDETAAFAPGT